MTPFEYISTKVFVKIKPSKIQGVGVFAIKDIPEGIHLFELWTGDTETYPISEEDLQSLPKELYTHIKDIFLYGPEFPSDTNTYVKLTHGCHWIYTTPYYFVNSDLNNFNIDKNTLQSNRIIRKGEEILSNYGRYERFSKKDLI
jgi:hypothetical protein